MAVMCPSPPVTFTHTPGTLSMISEGWAGFTLRVSSPLMISTVEEVSANGSSSRVPVTVITPMEAFSSPSSA